MRKDYFTDKIVIINEEIQKDEVTQKEIRCPYCPGNEELTPPAKLVLVQKEKALFKLSDSEDERIENWSVRAFLKNIPTVLENSELSYSEEPLYSEPAFSYHYIIIATPKHDEYLPLMSLEQWENVLMVIQDRTRWLYSHRKVSYVAIFSNHKLQGNSQVEHPNLEIMTLPRLPPLIEQEANKVRISLRENGVCPMCDVISIESGGPREIISTKNFIAFVPWAPTHHFEFWIFPKKHQISIVKITQKEISDLALILRCTLGGLYKALNDPPFSLIFHISSEKKTTRELHWHIEVYPQIRKWDGFEKGTHMYLNQVKPEKASKILGDAARKELATIIGVAL